MSNNDEIKLKLSINGESDLDCSVAVQELSRRLSSASDGIQTMVSRNNDSAMSLGTILNVIVENQNAVLTVAVGIQAWLQMRGRRTRITIEPTEGGSVVIEGPNINAREVAAIITSMRKKHG